MTLYSLIGVIAVVAGVIVIFIDFCKLMGKDMEGY